MILHHKFIECAKAHGKKTAIIDRMTGSTVTYSKALIASLILANKFSNYPEKNIGIMIPTSAGAMLSTIGTLMADKIPVMINYSTGAADNALYAQKKANFQTIITSRSLLKKINCPLIDGMIFIEDIMKNIKPIDKIVNAILSKLPLPFIKKVLPKSSKEDTACILFTSGSEKEPKGVQLSHKNLACNVEDVIGMLELKDSDTIFSVLPLFHVFGIQTNFWMPLTTGMTTVTYANPLDYKNIPKIIKEEKCSIIAATPTFLSGYLRASKEGDFESLKLIVAGADKTPEWLRDEYRDRHGIEIVEGYGATETSPVISVNSLKNNRPGSIGHIVPHAEVKIIGIDSGKEVPTGSEGKILVKGDLVMKGYLDNEKTKKAIIDGWYDTGDIGMFDSDGFLWHKGRLKRFIKVGGEMVSIPKTELEISLSIESGVDFCVVDVPDDIKGSALIAVFSKEVDIEHLKSELSQRLPSISIPKKYIVIPELPKMGSGKIDFRKTAEIVTAEI